jgi:hypothetical protein
MASDKQILGHIDCPTCGTAKGMRITHDKNGEPFGYCEAECSQQMRIGGDARRVRKFVERHPWAAAPGTGTGTAPPSAPAPVTAPQPKKLPVTVTAPEPVKLEKKKHGSPFGFLLGEQAA